MCHRRDNAAGWSVLEVLVVIAVVGVLIGLALPQLALMRERARAAKCLSNLRQAGVSTGAIVDQRRGLYPFWVANVPASPPVKRESMSEVYSGHVATLEIFRCPSDPVSKNALAEYSSYRYWPGEEMQEDLYKGPSVVIREVSAWISNLYTASILFDREDDWHDGVVHATFHPDWSARPMED